MQRPYILTTRALASTLGLSLFVCWSGTWQRSSGVAQSIREGAGVRGRASLQPTVFNFENNLWAWNSGTYVSLMWEGAEAKASYYHIYRFSVASGDWIRLNAAPIVSTKFVDATSGVRGDTLSYYVAAVTAYGQVVKTYSVVRVANNQTPSREVIAHSKDIVTSDSEFLNDQSMTLEDIQRFLETVVDGGSYLASYSTPDIDGSTRSAAEIIYDASQNRFNYSLFPSKINPEAILTKLEVEQSLITTASPPNRHQLRAAMGYAPGNEKYFGFAAQVDAAVWQLRRNWQRIANGQTAFGWTVGATKESCDFVNVTPQNTATADLYAYTPNVGVQWGGRYPDCNGEGTAGGNYRYFDVFYNVFGFGSGETLSVSLGADPLQGAAPLKETLAASVSGTTTGPINYTFWWNCSDPGTSVASVSLACGDPHLDEIGAKFDGIADGTKTTSHTYLSPGTYTAKVIAEQGAAVPAEQRIPIAVTTTSSQLIIGTVDPAGAQTKDWSEIVTYAITVVDGSGSPVAGATVLVTDNLQAASTSAPSTNTNGQTTYTAAVPSGKPNGIYDITFVATKSGSADSAPVTRQVHVSHSTSTPSLMISSVDPPSTQTSDWGGSVGFSITVRDNNNNPIGGATVLVTDNLKVLSTSAPLTNSSGQTTYTTVVPVGSQNGTYDIVFAASKSGYTSSASMVRQVVVNHVVPLSIASLTPGGLQIVDWGATVTYSMTVTDIGGTPVSGAVITGHDSLWVTDYATNPTNASGQTTYTTFAPNAKLNGVYDITFTATKSGYTDSTTLIRQVQVNHTGTITVTEPVAGAMWTVGTPQLVTWSSSGVIGKNVKLSTDGGSTFPITLVSNTVNSDSAEVVVPNTPSATCRVRVESATDPTVHGDNPGDFTIVASEARWAVQRSGGANLLAVRFVDTNQGWAVGGAGTILHTTNGGATWNPQTSPQSFYQYYAVYFADASNGWAGGIGGNGGVIVHTTNGGATWTVQFDGGDAVGTRVWWISGIGANQLWAASTGGLLYTTNGGANWQTRSMQALWKVRFADSSTGWATSQAGQILRTTDGGNNWQTKYNSSGTVLDVGFSAASAWGVGSLPFFKIVHTSDAGSTWQDQQSAIPTTLRSVIFIDSLVGWAVGDGGAIVNTVNSGAGWSAVSNLTSSILWDVFFIGGSGWAVGDGGVILKYATP